MNQLQITTHAQQKLRAYIDNCETEISGFGKIEIVTGGFLITDVKIFKQVVSSAHTDIDSDALGAFLYDITKAGDEVEKWTLWWHSHASMKAFFSVTDDDTIKGSSEMPYLVSLVGNHDGEWEARYDTYKPVHATSELEVVLLSEFNKEITQSCVKEIKELVSETFLYQSPYQSKSYEGYQDVKESQIYLPYNDKRKRPNKRQRELIQKAEEGEYMLTEQEKLEIQPFYDTLDNDL